MGVSVPLDVIVDTGHVEAMIFDSLTVTITLLYIIYDLNRQTAGELYMFGQQTIALGQQFSLDPGRRYAW